MAKRRSWWRLLKPVPCWSRMMAWNSNCQSTIAVPVILWTWWVMDWVKTVIQGMTCKFEHLFSTRSFDINRWQQLTSKQRMKTGSTWSSPAHLLRSARLSGTRAADPPQLQRSLKNTANSSSLGLVRQGTFCILRYVQRFESVTDVKHYTNIMYSFLLLQGGILSSMPLRGLYGSWKNKEK